MRTLLSLLTAGLLLSGSARAHPQGKGTLGPGQALGSVELTDLTGTRAEGFGDYHGRLVLLEFFAHWCGPCALSVPHLNELSETFGARGLTILGVTSEAPRDTVPWVRRHGVSYAYGYDPDGQLARRLGVTGLPTAVLVDPLGTILWKGHPAKLRAQNIEPYLDGALPRAPCDWPEALDGVREELAAGRPMAAVEAARNLGPVGQEVLPRLEALVELRLERARAFARQGDALGLEESCERFSLELAGSDAVQELAALLRAAREDGQWEATLAAQRRVRRLSSGRLRRAERVAEVRRELERLAAEHPGGIVERDVQRALRALPR